MDILKHAFSVVKSNIKLALILAIIAITGGITHFFNQTISYSSNFKTNNGFVDYALFKSLTDFTSVNTDIYDLPEDELNKIVEQISDFEISYIEETSAIYSFTVSSKMEGKDHDLIQKDILTLINNNRFIKNSQASEVNVMERKLAFLKEKISQLDSFMMAPSSNTRMSSIPSDSYLLYSQQLDLEEKIKYMGNFRIIKPITSIKTNKRPLIMFTALYLVLAGFVFMIFSKKNRLEN